VGVCVGVGVWVGVGVGIGVEMGVGVISGGVGVGIGVEMGVGVLSGRVGVGSVAVGVGGVDVLGGVGNGVDIGVGVEVATLASDWIARNSGSANAVPTSDLMNRRLDSGTPFNAACNVFLDCSESLSVAIFFSLI
jgi:hypothetical protein